MWKLIILITGYPLITSTYSTSIECYQALGRQSAYFRSQGKHIQAAHCIPVLRKGRR